MTKAKAEFERVEVEVRWMTGWCLGLMAVPAADRVGSQTARHMAERCEAASEVQVSQPVSQSVLQAGEAALH